MNDQSLSTSRKLQAGNIFAGGFKLLEKIGSGSFGFVYKTLNLKNGDIVATKFEVKEEKSSKKISLLVREIKVLIDLKGTDGFPQIIFYGKDESYHFLMETYLGANLEEILIKCGGKFSQSTVLQIAVQIITRIEKFHSKNFIHRDLKPENLVIGRTDSSLVHLIDFGLSKFYRDSQGKHIPYVTDKGLIGTARYASVSSMQGNEQSRRDDMEAIGYILVYFLDGRLPWMNIAVANREEKCQKVLERKLNTSIPSLCINAPKVKVKFFLNLVQCFQEYFEIVKKLSFEECPDYQKLRQLFQDELDSQNSRPLDWILLNEYKGVDEISIDQKLEQASSVDHEGNLHKQYNNLKNAEQKLLNVERNQQKQLFLDIPKKGHDNQLLNVSIDSSKLNHYQQSQQKLASTGLLMFPSSKQFDDMKIPTTQELGFLSQKIIESKSKISIANKNLFDDLEVADDDQPGLQLKSNNILNKGRKKIFL